MDEDRLADTRTAEQTNLSTLREGAEKVDHLQAGLEDLTDGLLLLEGRGGAVDRGRVAAADLAARLSARNDELAGTREQLRAAEAAVADSAARVAAVERERDTVSRDLQAVVDARARAEAAADGAGGQAKALAARLDDTDTRLAASQEALDKRTQEVRCCSVCLGSLPAALEVR